VEDPVADVLVLDEIKDLGLIDVAGVGSGMKDAVGVHCKILAVALSNALFKATPNGLGTPGGVRSEAGFLLPVELLAQLS